jgi:microcystin-dependent protein
VSRFAWLTPEDEPGELRCFRIFCPAGDEYEAALRGALIPLCDPENWEQKGSQTPEDTAAAFVDALAASYTWQECETGGNGLVVSIGCVLPWAGSGDLPAGYLECDGAEYAQATYPDLYAVIGDTFGNAAPGNFCVPDLCSRMPIGAGPANDLSERLLGDVGGEEEHTLTENEMPQHKHSVPLGYSGLVAASGSAQRVPTTGPTDTSFVGLNAAHNNMPPFAVLRFMIAAFTP